METEAKPDTGQVGAVAYDTETTGLALHYGDKLFAYSVCTEQGRSDAVRMDGRDGVSPQQGRRELEWLWSPHGSATPKVSHNAKFDLTATENFLGRSLQGHRVHCTHKMSHILQNHHHTHTLDHLAWELAGYDRIDHVVRGIAAELGGYHKVPPHIMRKYQLLDAERCMCLYLFFYPQIAANPRWLDCYNVEMDLIWTTMRLERRGVMLHTGRTARMIDELEAKAEDARERIYGIIGKRFNPDSDVQLRRVLYKDLGFPVLKRTAKSGEPSLDKYVMIELREKTQHPVFDEILQCRAYSKGAEALRGYMRLADKDGVIHPTINTCQAITGRQSSENPNLQNVQKSTTAANPYPVLVRHAFRPRPGYVNVHVDYAGIEMRLAVHYAQEPEMIHCLVKGDGDVHALGAEAFYARRFTSAIGKARKVLRDRAKNGGFALIYGASPAKLGAVLGLTPQEATAAHARYRARFPRLVGMFRDIMQTVKDRGHVDTVFGRCIHVPSGEAFVGCNYLIQGTAAEILKRAEVRVDKYNREHTGDEVKLLLPIHDEIVLECPRGRLADLPGYLRDIRLLMTDFPQFRVPLEIDADIVTSSWEHKSPVRVPK